MRIKVVERRLVKICVMVVEMTFRVNYQLTNLMVLQ